MLSSPFPLLIAEDLILNERLLLKTVEDGKIMLSEKSVRYIVIHCSSTRVDRDYPWEQMRKDHRAQGFMGIAYHFYIRKDGSITQHRCLLDVGAHCRPFNRCSIGICYEGGLGADGLPADTRTLAQREQLLSLLFKLHKIFPQALICGHRDLPGNTHQACPCFNAYWEYQDM